MKNIFHLIKFIYDSISYREKLIFWLSLIVNSVSSFTPTLILYLTALIIGKLSHQDFNNLYLFSFLFVFISLFANTLASINNFISDTLNDIIWSTVKTNIFESVSLPYRLSIFEDKEKRKQLTMSLLFGDEVDSSIPSLMAVIFGFIHLLPLVILISTSIWWAPFIILASLVPFVYISVVSQKQTWDVMDKHENEFSSMRIYERVLTQPEFAKEIRIFKMQNKMIYKWIHSFKSYF
ncbi:MAG: hypothetical protein GKC53_05930 [Neisseriaceae bacterium]|nr:MAG: hypothetical protein GKC53_05930 [Neisseriaceae bacterium]